VNRETEREESIQRERQAGRRSVPSIYACIQGINAQLPVKYIKMPPDVTGQGHAIMRTQHTFAYETLYLPVNHSCHVCSNILVLISHKPACDQPCTCHATSTILCFNKRTYATLSLGVAVCLTSCAHSTHIRTGSRHSLLMLGGSPGVRIH
jgi:hypothetical protein